MNEEQRTPERRVRRRFSAEDRRRLIDEFKASGLTARAFSRQVGIHPTTLSGWMHRDPSAGRTAGAVGFAELSIPISTAAPIEVDLPNGVRIRVRTTGDVARTAELIRAVAAPLSKGPQC